MSWAANAVGSKAVEQLETCLAQDYNLNAKEVIQAQLDLINAILTKVPEGHICIVEASGHIDSYSVHQKIETRIFRA